MRRVFIVIFYLISSVFVFGKMPSGRTFIKVYLEKTLPSDTIRMDIYEHYFPISLPERTVLLKKISPNEFSFVIHNVSIPFYFSLYKDFVGNNYPDYLMKLYLAEPGDSINIRIGNKCGTDNQSSNSKFSLTFTGKGSEKYTCRYIIDEAISSISGPRRVVDSSFNFTINNYLEYRINKAREILKIYKKK